MEVSTRKENNVMIVFVKGRMDAVSSLEFEKELLHLMDQGERRFIVDLRDLEHISSAGLRIILVAAKRLKQAQGKFVLSSLQDIVKEVFDISGFSAVIPISRSTESALSDIQ